MSADLRSLVRALVDSLPTCDVCGEPATRAWGRGGGRWCDEHSGATEYPRGARLRAVLAALDPLARLSPADLADVPAVGAAEAKAIMDHAHRRMRGVLASPAPDVATLQKRLAEIAVRCDAAELRADRLQHVDPPAAQRSIGVLERQLAATERARDDADARASERDALAQLLASSLEAQRALVTALVDRVREVDRIGRALAYANAILEDRGCAPVAPDYAGLDREIASLVAWDRERGGLLETEREACAAIADANASNQETYGSDNGVRVARLIASEIRARGNGASR